MERVGLSPGSRYGVHFAAVGILLDLRGWDQAMDGADAHLGHADPQISLLTETRLSCGLWQALACTSIPRWPTRCETAGYIAFGSIGLMSWK